MEIRSLLATGYLLLVHAETPRHLSLRHVTGFAQFTHGHFLGDQLSRTSLDLPAARCR
jgi:hypothetical protein